jgi:hypothetical protein
MGVSQVERIRRCRRGRASSSSPGRFVLMLPLVDFRQVQPALRHVCERSATAVAEGARFAITGQHSTTRHRRPDDAGLVDRGRHQQARAGTLPLELVSIVLNPTRTAAVPARVVQIARGIASFRRLSRWCAASAP